MKIAAIYENGRVECDRPIQFKHPRIRLMLEIRDSEIIRDASQIAQFLTPVQSSLMNEIDAILGSIKSKLEKQPSLMAEDYKVMWHEHLEEKYLGPN